MFKVLGAGNCGLAFGTYMIREHLDFSANVCFGGVKLYDLVAAFRTKP